MRRHAYDYQLTRLPPRLDHHWAALHLALDTARLLEQLETYAAPVLTYHLCGDLDMPWSWLERLIEEARRQGYVITRPTEHTWKLGAAYEQTWVNDPTEPWFD